MAMDLRVPAATVWLAAGGFLPTHAVNIETTNLQAVTALTLWKCAEVMTLPLVSIALVSPTTTLFIEACGCDDAISGLDD